MVNLPPDSNESRRRTPTLDFDELLAVVLAFLGIGAILWWGLSRDQSLLTGANPLRPSQETPAGREAEGREATDDPSALFQPRSFEEGRSILPTPSAQRGEAPEESLPHSSSLQPERTVIAPIPVAPNASTAETAPSTEQAVGIADVPLGHWAYPFIKPMYDAGYLPDFPSGQFQPDQMLTRADLAALINQAFGDPNQPPTTGQPTDFSDVSADYWAADAINQAVAQGFMSGYPENTFQPDRTIPRYEAIVAIVAGLQLPEATNPDQTLQSFVDSGALPGWSRGQVATAAEQSLIVNHPNPDQLDPNQVATRADIVALLHQALVSQGKLPAVNSEYAVPAP